MTEDAPSTGSRPKPDDTAPLAGSRPSAAPTGAAAGQPQTAVVGTPPPPPGTTTAVADPPPPPPSAPLATPRPRRPGMGLLPIALGVGLLAAAIVLSTSRARSDGDIDWSNYAVGLASTALLLLVAVFAMVVGTGRPREELATWPGVVGILGVGAMLGVGLEDVGGSEDWLAYLIGGVVVLLSVVGYVATRRGAFVVTAILGLAMAYVQLSDDVIVDIGDDSDWPIIAAATIAAFVLVVTAVGWLLPTRALSGVVVGVAGVVGFNVVLIALVITQLVASFFNDFGAVEGDTSGGSGFFVADGGGPSYDNDIYVILAIAAVLTLLWALAASLEGNPGFTVLAIAMPASIVPTATFVLAVEHPTWWGVGFAAVGAVLLAIVGVTQLRRRRT